MSQPVPWDESIADATLRGATHFQRDIICSALYLLLREGNRTRLRARSTGVFPVLFAVSTLSSCRARIGHMAGPRSKENCPAIPGLERSLCVSIFARLYSLCPAVWAVLIQLLRG